MNIQFSYEFLFGQSTEFLDKIKQEMVTFWNNLNIQISYEFSFS